MTFSCPNPKCYDNSNCVEHVTGNMADVYLYTDNTPNPDKAELWYCLQCHQYFRVYFEFSESIQLREKK